MDAKTIFTLDSPLSHGDDDLHRPAMPVVYGQPNQHRPKNEFSGWPTFSAAVARPIKRAEFERNPDAKAAMDSEVKRHQDRGVWNVKLVEEWRDVQARMQRDPNTQVHTGIVFGICVERFGTTTGNRGPEVQRQICISGQPGL